MISIDHAKKLLEIRGFKIEDKEPVLATLLELLALHPRIFGTSNVNLKTMQSVLREHGFRLDDTDPVLLILALHDIALKDLIRTIKPEHAPYVLTAGKLAALCIPVFIAGLLLGAREGLGVGFMAILTLGLGVGLVGGLLFSQKLITWDQIFRKATVESKNIMDYVWTSEDVTRAGLEMKVSPRALTACKSILIDKESSTVAARKEHLFPAQVERELIKLEIWKKNYRK